MASGDPSPALINQIQKIVCQLCGQNTGQSSKEIDVNYQKQVDEPIPPYSQIIPDSRYDEIEANERKSKNVKEQGNTKNTYHVCVQLPRTAGQSTKPARSGNTDSNAKDKIQTKAPDNSGIVKGACLPAGGCPPPLKLMLCLPCPPPDALPGASSGSGSSQQCKKKNKPKDYTYRCESRELRGGNLYQCCQCIKRNGLQHDCPRTPCQGRPACLIKPWPDCWPSGGCHGIDYSRENGVKRYDPCKEQRFDKKECKPPSNSGTSSGKSDMRGNMMVVVCPQMQQQ